MRFFRVAALLLGALSPVAAAVPRVLLPTSGLGVAGYSGAASISAAPSLAAALPTFSAPSLAVPTLAPAAFAPAALPAALEAGPSAAASAPAAEAAAAPAGVPALAGTENGLIRTPDVAVGLAALRAASYATHPQVEEIVARIKATHPELPISAENLFLVKDRDLLETLGIPAEAGGAARLVTDGTREVPVVILVAANGVGLDEFVEFAVHEAVHLMDDGILRVSHDQDLKHFFAEGWTQKRAVTMANAVLAGLGRPATPGKAYHAEISLVDAFIALHGSAALDELVRTGSDAGLRRALGDRWDLAARLVAGEDGKPGKRERRLQALTALIGAKWVGPDEERALVEHAGR
jgi:hypothetical protein